MPPAPAQPDRPRLTPAVLFVLAAVLLFPLIAAAVGLAAPALASRQARSAAVLAANHLLTLGWGTTAALGALHQLLPAAAGVRSAPGWPVAVQFALHLAGVAVMAGGFRWRAWGVLAAGGTMVLLSVLASAVAAARILRRRTRWSLPLAGVAGALLSLLLAASWGLLLALNFRFAFQPALLTPPGLIVHMSLGLIGWFGGLVIAVSYYLLPRFAAWRPDVRGARAVLWLLAAGTAALAAGAFAAPPLARAGLAAVGAAGLLYAADVRRAVRAWGRGRDLTRVHWQLILVETVLLAAGAAAYALGVLPRVPPWPPAQAWAAAGAALFLTGWVTLAITGQAYKVTPFLMWHYRFAQGLPAYDVPRLEAPYWPRGGAASFALLGAAGPLISLGTLLGSPAIAGAGGLLFAAGAGVFSYLLGYSWLMRLWRLRRAVSGSAAGRRPAPP